MLVSPSILAADFLRLNEEIEMINNSEADLLHLDVMDGVFVPNISFGFPVLEAVGKICQKPLDVHLMIVKPENWINRVRDIGAYMLNIHYEACLHLESAINKIHEAGMKAAVTLNPASPVSLLTDIIEELDMVLIMSVNPGFGGQKFINQTFNKIKKLKELITESNSKALIEVDGGVNIKTGKELSKAGADILVSGSYIFKSKDPKQKIIELKNL